MKGFDLWLFFLGCCIEALMSGAQMAYGNYGWAFLDAVFAIYLFNRWKTNFLNSDTKDL